MTIDRRTVLAAAPLVAAPLLFTAPAYGADPLKPLKTYEKKTGGKIGLYAENLATGKKLTWRHDQRFVMCSTFKASLAACVLSRVDMGQEKLDRMVPYGDKDLLDYAPIAKAKDNLARGALSVEALCKGAVELSDNTCANLLLAAIGGPAALTNFWRTTGDGVSRLDANEPELNRSKPGDPHNTTTPQAMAVSLKHFVLGQVLMGPSRERLTTWLLNCQTGANRLRAGLPKAWMVGDKTGNNGSDAAGDIAVAWIRPGAPVLMAVYTQGGSPRPDDLNEVFAAAGRMVGERLKA